MLLEWQRVWLQGKKHTREQPTLLFIIFTDNWEGLIVPSESLNRNPGDSEISWMFVCTQLPSIVVSEIFHTDSRTRSYHPGGRCLYLVKLLGKLPS